MGLSLPPEQIKELHKIHDTLHDILFERCALTCEVAVKKSPQAEDHVIQALQRYYKQGWDINVQLVDDVCQGSTLLMVAAYCRCLKVVDWLLHHHADINLRHLTHVGYNAFSILATPSITNQLAKTYRDRHGKTNILPGAKPNNFFVHPHDNFQVDLIYQTMTKLASHAVAVQPACAFSLIAFIALTDLTVMPPVNLVNLVLEQITISSAHFFVLIDSIDFFVQIQSKFAASPCVAVLEEQQQLASVIAQQGVYPGPGAYVSPNSTGTASPGNNNNNNKADTTTQQQNTPATYISINTTADRTIAMQNFLHLFDILIYHLEKMPIQQEMILNEHYKYKPIFRLLQDCDLQHTQYPVGTLTKDNTFIIPPHNRVKPLKDAETSDGVRYKNQNLLKEGEAPPKQTDLLTNGQPAIGGLTTGSGSGVGTGGGSNGSDELVNIDGQAAGLVSNTVLPAGVTDAGLVASALEHGEDRIRVKAPRNFYLPIFFLLRAAQPHLATVLFYIQRHYYGFMQEFVEHKFRQLEIVPKLNKTNISEFFAFLQREPSSLPHGDVPHDLELFDKSLEDYHARIAEREQLTGRLGRLQMKLSVNSKQDPRIVDSYANYLLFKQVIKFSYPYTNTTLAILELLFAVYDMTGNTYLSCCREARQKKQRDQQLKKSDLKSYHSPECPYFEHYCELLLTFTQYGRYRNKQLFTDELLSSIGPLASHMLREFGHNSPASALSTPSSTQLLQNYTKVQHDTAFLQVHSLLCKNLTDLSILARRARLAPHIYSNLYIYGQHQTSTIRYVLDELKGPDRYHLQAQDLANLDYNIMSYIGNLGNNDPNNHATNNGSSDLYPATNRELIDVITNAISYFFDFDANFFITQNESLQTAQNLEDNPNRLVIKSYTVDGGDVSHPIINPNGCAWRFTRVKECVAYLSSIEYFWHHMIRLVYHLMNNNAMNPEMISAILSKVLEHGLTYRSTQIRTIFLSFVYNIPGYFQGQNAPSYPLISAQIIKSLGDSGNAVGGIGNTLKTLQTQQLTTTRTITESTTRSTQAHTITTRSGMPNQHGDDSDDDNAEDDNTDYHYTTAAIGTSNAIISSIEQDSLRQVRFYIVNMSDHQTIVRNVIALFAFLKSLHVKSKDVVVRENKELKERKKRFKQRQRDGLLDDDEEMEYSSLMAEYFQGIPEEDDDGENSESSLSASHTSSRRYGQRHFFGGKKELLNEHAGTTYKSAVVLKRDCPQGGERFYMRFSEFELQFVNKFFNIPSSFECIPMFYKIYREFLTLYWEPLDDEDEDFVDESRAKDKLFDQLPIPPPVQFLLDSRLLGDNATNNNNNVKMSKDDQRNLIENNTQKLITPTPIHTLTSKSIVPGNRTLPMALHCLFPTAGSRMPLMLKCYEIELASFVVKYRDYLSYDPFCLFRGDAFKIIINHLQQFQVYGYYCYSELVVNISMMLFLAIGRYKWQTGKYKELLLKPTTNNKDNSKDNKKSNNNINSEADNINIEIDPSDYHFFDFNKDEVEKMKEYINTQTPWSDVIELKKTEIAAMEVFKEELIKYIIFYCTDNKRRGQTMTAVLSRIEKHILDRSKLQGKSQKYKHYVHSLFFPIQQPNHPWFPLTNSLLDPYMGFYTVIDNVHFTVFGGNNNDKQQQQQQQQQQGQQQQKGNTLTATASVTIPQNQSNTPYQHYSRLIRPDYTHIKTYSEFFEATTYDVNNLHYAYFHYSQQNPFHHDQLSKLRYKFQYNRDYTFALYEMMHFYHSIQTTSFFSKLRLGKPQLTSYVCKPYQRMYMSKLLSTYKDFVQRDNTTTIPEAHRYIINYKYLCDVKVDINTPQKNRVDYLLQKESLLTNSNPQDYLIGKDNKFNFDMYPRLIQDYTGDDNVKEQRLVLPEQIVSYNKKKINDVVKVPPHSHLHGSAKEKANKVLQNAGEGACYSENPLFTLREQEIIYHNILQNVINYYSIGEFKHLTAIDIDVVTFYIKKILQQRDYDGISYKSHFINIGHNFTPFQFDMTRLLNSHINIYTIKLFSLLFKYNIIQFQQRQLSVDLPPPTQQTSLHQLPGQITIDELTHRRAQSTSTALYTAQRIPVYNHNLTYIDQPHHNIFNILIAHQFAYDVIHNEPLYQLKLPTHTIEYDSFTFYDHKMQNEMLLSLAHVDNLTSTMATRMFSAIQSYMRQLSPVLQRNMTVGQSGNNNNDSDEYDPDYYERRNKKYGNKNPEQQQQQQQQQQVVEKQPENIILGGAADDVNGDNTNGKLSGTEIFQYTAQLPFINFLKTRNTSFIFDLLELFYDYAVKAKYDMNLKHIIFNMLHKQTVVFNQLNVQVLSYLLEKNQSLNKQFMNTVKYEVELLLISQHLFWNPAQIHTTLFYTLFDLFFKKQHYRKIASIVHLNQLSRLCVITDVLYHFRLPVYPNQPIQEKLLAFDRQDTYQEQLSLHQFQLREKDHKDSRENLNKKIAITTQYLQLFNFNAPVVSQSTLTIIHDLLGMGRGFCASCQIQAKHTLRQRFERQSILQERITAKAKAATTGIPASPTSNQLDTAGLTPQTLVNNNSTSNNASTTISPSSQKGNSSTTKPNSKDRDIDVGIDTATELVSPSRNVCSCQSIMSAYQYFQGLVEGLIRRERFLFIRDAENHTWSPRVTVAQALYDIMFYYNMYQHNVQNTNARRYMQRLEEEQFGGNNNKQNNSSNNNNNNNNTSGNGKEMILSSPSSNNNKPQVNLKLSTQHLHWINGTHDMTMGEVHNLPKHPLPEGSGMTCYSFNNKHANIVHALINHPIDKIRSQFDVTKIYPNKTITFDVTYDKVPLQYNKSTNAKLLENKNSNVKNLSVVSLYEFLCDWYAATKPSENDIQQIHQMLTSFNNTTVGLLPNNTLYTGYDGTKGFFLYILNNVYQPSVDDIKALLPVDDKGYVLNPQGKVIFKSFINEILPSTQLVNNAKQNILANIIIRRWKNDVLQYIFEHPMIFGQGVDAPQTQEYFEYEDMFNCTLADYLLSCNTFNYAFHLVRPFVLKYYRQ